MTLPATYSFTTTENPLSATYWTETAWAALQAATGYCKVVTTGFANSAMYWSADTPDAAQYSQLVFTTGSNSVCGPIVRLTAASPTFYCAYAETGATRILRKYSGSWTALASSSASFSVPEILKITASGSTLTYFAEGSQLLQATDAAYATGQIGIFAAAGAVENTLDDWEGGNLGSAYTAAGVESFAGVYGRSGQFKRTPAGIL